jgi:hypothetical protein
MIRAALILAGLALVAWGQYESAQAKRNVVYHSHDLSEGSLFEVPISCRDSTRYTVEFSVEVPRTLDPVLVRDVEDRCKSETPLFIVTSQHVGNDAAPETVSSYCRPGLARIPSHFTLSTIPCTQGENARVSLHIVRLDPILVRMNYAVTTGPAKLREMSMRLHADTARFVGFLLVLLGATRGLLRALRARRLRSLARSTRGTEEVKKHDVGREW